MTAMRLGRSGIVLLLVALLTGCTTLPTSGPIVDVGDAGLEGNTDYTYYEPNPPKAGATPAEIVAGFLEAMKATGIKTSVARQYLTKLEQNRWHPEEGIITYAQHGTPVGNSQVNVRLENPQLLDERGSWLRTLTGSGEVLDFRLAQESTGEWRINRAPDALIVPETWFNQRFQRASVYYQDPTGQILIPEPIFVPAGKQMATALVNALLSGAPPGPTGVAVNGFGQGLQLAGVSVPVEAGIATISLEGTLDDVGPLVAAPALAQLTWTLRQVPGLRGIRMLVNELPVPLPGGAPSIDLDQGTAYDPNVYPASSQTYALRDGLLVAGSMNQLSDTSGVLGNNRYALRSVSVDPTGTSVLGVSLDGTSAITASVSDPDVAAVTVLRGADLSHGSWDFSSRTWLFDRRNAGAVIWRIDDSVPTAIQVPGISGEAVKAMLASRDGSRLVAVVRGPKADQVVVSRLRYAPGGRMLSATPAEPMLEEVAGRRIRDIAWQSPTTVAVLGQVEQQTAQIRVVAVDGAPEALERSMTYRILGRPAHLIGTPVAGEGLFVRRGRTLIDVTAPNDAFPELEQAIVSLTFAG